jgi:hypothetical protein
MIFSEYNLLFAAGGRDAGQRRRRLDTLGVPITKMLPCERISMSFTETAPYRFTNSVDLAITPEQLLTRSPTRRPGPAGRV